MKRGFLAIGLLVITTCLQSCVVVIDDKQGHSRESRGHQYQDKTITEIDAVSKLVLESHKRDAYKKIAGRDYLNPEAQIHLTKAVFDNLVLESSKEEVLLTLIKNPSFCPAGEQTILNKLDKLALESNKQNILNAISEQKTQG
jgi:hypothetical protein